MKTLSFFLTIFFLVAAIGCSDNPAAHDDGDEELSVEFLVSVEHIDTLEDITFTAVVTTHHGDPVTDLEEISMQYRQEGSVDWRDLVLTLSGTSYTGTLMFMSSGEYEVRVMGRHLGHDHMETLHELAEHMHVGRAHQDVGGFRVEYESMPGHIHSGDTATLRYWVMEDTAALQPITGLQAEIHCGDPSGTDESHSALEAEAGVYTAEHTFQADGEAHIALHFPGAGGAELEAEFHFPVAHGH